MKEGNTIMGESLCCPLRNLNPCKKTCQWFMKEHDKCAIVNIAENVNQYTYNINPEEKEDIDDGR